MMIEHRILCDVQWPHMCIQAWCGSSQLDFFSSQNLLGLSRRAIVSVVSVVSVVSFVADPVGAAVTISAKSRHCVVKIWLLTNASAVLVGPPEAQPAWSLVPLPLGRDAQHASLTTVALQWHTLHANNASRATGEPRTQETQRSTKAQAAEACT